MLKHKLRATGKIIKLMAIIAAMMVFASAAGISAYMTGTDSNTNTFTVGDVDITIHEENWDPASLVDLKPGQVFPKDPSAENTGDNPCFLFVEIVIPKKQIYTYDAVTKARDPLAVTELFNMENRASWDSPNSGWALVSSDISDTDANKYVYAYGASSKMTKIDPQETTQTAVFDKLQYCYAVEGQGLDGETLTIRVNAYAIQSDNLAGSNTDVPTEVWGIIKNQIPG